jgi:hypothetical protein
MTEFDFSGTQKQKKREICENQICCQKNRKTRQISRQKDDRFDFQGHSKAGPSSLRKLFLPFFPFFLVPSYVGYVPASNDLGICCFVWRYEFSSKFSFVTEEKFTFRNEAPDLPKHFKFWEIPKRFTKTFHLLVLPQYCWVGLFRYKELTIHLPLVSITANLSTP